MTKNVTIFCCSACEDDNYLGNLLNHLELLPKREAIVIWSNKKITSGSHRERAINKYLTTAQIILLLVSPNFIASPSCKKATQQALVRCNNEGTRVIPILVCPVHWENTSFGVLQPLPRNEKPVSRWDDEHDAWFTIVTEIGEVVETLLSQAQQPDPLQQPPSNPFSPLLAPQPQMASAQQATTAVPPPASPLNNHQPLPLIVPLRKRNLLISLGVVGTLLIIGSIVSVTVLHLPFPPGIPHRQQPTASHSPDCVPSGISSDGIGVYLCKGEHIGISDGSYVLDTNKGQQVLDDKQKASQELQAGHPGTAMSLWSAAHELDTTDAEPLIYKENLRVKASGQPYITFVVGVLLGTQPFDSFSRDYLQAAYIAQIEHNNQSRSPGGVLVRLLIAKSGSDPNQSAMIARQVVTAAKADSTIVGVMGWPTTNTSQDVIPILAQAHIPMVTPGAVSDGLTGISPYFFRVGSPNKVIAQMLVQYIETSLKAKCVVLFQDVHEPYSQNLAQAFEEQYPTAGYEGRLIIQPFKTGVKDTKDLSRSVQEVLKKDNPDVLMFTSDDVNDMITVLKTADADASSSRVKVVMGTAAYAVIEAYAAIEPNKPFVGYNRLLFSTGAYPDEWIFFHAVQSPFFQDYASMFDPHHKNPGTYSYSRPNALVMLGYDAMQTLFYASKLAFDAGKNHPFSPDQLQMALTQIQGAQALQGITGQISFGPDRDPTNKLNFVLYADNRQHLKIACWQGSFFINSSPVKWRCA